MNLILINFAKFGCNDVAKFIINEYPNEEEKTKIFDLIFKNVDF